MKKLLSILLLISSIAFSQAPPQGISHRGTAYNTAGILLSNATIKIKVSILEGAAPVYSEIHTLTTNQLGQYSFNIGILLSSPPTIPNNVLTTPNVAFNTINWANGINKDLKIEIDPTGVGTTYPVIGSNQLMSVPYALYAENANSNNTLRVLKNIDKLRHTAGKLNEIIYIKGHTTEGDGGEGNFIWKALPIGNLNDNDGTIVRNDSISTSAGWIRIIEDKINVKYFGIKFDNTDGIKIQKAIDFAQQNAFNDIVLQSPDTFYRDYTQSGSTVYIPSGTYTILGKITLKYGVSIEGDGTSNTILKADNTIQDGTMIDLDSGQVTGINLSNMSFDGGISQDESINSTVTKKCMYLKSQIDSIRFGGTGGLWNSTFKNIKIYNFNGSGIVLEGGGFNSQSNNSDFLSPNQFLVFENVNVFRQKDVSNCLLIRGHQGQLTFIDCDFDGLMKNNLTTKLFNVAIEANAVESSVIKFLTCTFQYSEYGVFTSYAESVTFDNCWFEDLDIGVYATKSVSGFTSKCINIINSRFANASGFGTLYIENKNKSGGTCIAVEGGSNVNVQNNYVCTSDPSYNNNISNNYFIRNIGLDSKINASNNSFQNASLGRTYGIANNTITPTNSAIETSSYKFLKVNAYSSNISEIKSNISAGETITIKANGLIKFDNAKNIVFAKASVTAAAPFVLNANETVTFMKIDNPITVNSVTYNETYVLIASNKLY